MIMHMSNFALVIEQRIHFEYSENIRNESILHT